MARKKKTEQPKSAEDAFSKSSKTQFLDAAVIEDEPEIDADTYLKQDEKTGEENGDNSASQEKDFSWTQVMASVDEKAAAIRSEKGEDTPDSAKNDDEKKNGSPFDDLMDPNKDEKAEDDQIEDFLDALVESGMLPNGEDMKDIMKMSIKNAKKQLPMMHFADALRATKPRYPIIKIELTAANQKRLYQETGKRLKIFTQMDPDCALTQKIQEMTPDMVEDWVVEYYKAINKARTMSEENMREMTAKIKEQAQKRLEEIAEKQDR